MTERDFSQHDLLIIYIDGLRFGDYVAVAAVGVDVQGNKHVLALREGATENAEVAKSLLDMLIARGVKPGRRRLFVIDGAKAKLSGTSATRCQFSLESCEESEIRAIRGRSDRSIP